MAKAHDKCSKTACGSYAVGCTPMPMPDGTMRRWLQPNPNERFCKSHHPQLAKKRSERQARAQAARGLCPSLSADKSPFCGITSIGRPRRRELIACEAVSGRLLSRATCLGVRFAMKYERPRRCRKRGSVKR